MATEQPILSPLRVEQQFQTLKQSLRLLASPRARLLHILNFAEPLLNDRSTSILSGYAAEIAQALSTLIIQTEFVGTPLTLIERTQHLIDTVARVNPEATRIDSWETALHRLTEQYALILAWMQSRGSGQPLVAIPEGKIGCAWVPMVEQEPLVNIMSPQFASLGLLHVDLSIKRGKHAADNIHLAGLSQQESHNETHARTGLQAARALTKNITRKPYPHKVSARCWFSSLYERNLVVGESFEAGFAAAVATEMLRLQEHREEFCLRGDVAITGRIDPDGRLQPIAENGLPLKVQACTYSWIRLLVVPERQAELCAQLAKQSADEATRALRALIVPVEIIAARALDDAFQSRRIADSRRVPVVLRTARSLWRQRRPVALAVFAALLLIIWRFWYGPLDKNPVGHDFEGSTLLAKNKSGEVVDRIDVGGTTVIAWEDNRKVFDTQMVDFWDVDSDGVNEVFWLEKTEAKNAEMMLRCKRVDADEPLWSFPLVKTLEFASSPDVSDNLFMSRYFDVEDVDNDGRAEVLVLASHRAFPGLVLMIDAVTGEEKAHYVHIGHLQSLRLKDLDNDGVKEILVCGSNNSFRSAVFAVLDPRTLGGHSPLQDTYSIKGYEPANEKAYVRIDRTVVGQLYGKQIPYNFAVNITVDSLLITVQITDVPMMGDTPKDRFSSTVYAQFDYDLNIVGIPTGDNFDTLYDYHVSLGDIPDVPRHEYLRQYQKSIRYWDGEKFVGRGEIAWIGKSSVHTSIISAHSVDCNE